MRQPAKPFAVLIVGSVFVLCALCATAGKLDDFEKTGYLVAGAGHYFFPLFFCGITWSGRRKPIPLYGTAHTRAAMGMYKEAIAEYEKIIQDFPDEIKPHIDLINIAITQLADPKRAEEFYRKGMNTLQDPTQREVLTKMYLAIRSRLKDGKSDKNAPIAYRKRQRQGYL